MTKYLQNNVIRYFFLVKNHLKSTSKVVIFNIFQFILVACLYFVSGCKFFKFAVSEALVKMQFPSPTSPSKLEGLGSGQGSASLTLNDSQYLE